MVSILLFAVYVLGLGTALTWRLPERPLWSRAAFGLGAFPLVALVLGRLGLPLDWRIFLGLSLIPLAAEAWRNRQRPISAFRSVISVHTLILTGILAFCAVMYCWGPFQYPWLENDDPWTHAAGAKYIALEKNLNVPPGEFHYFNPYPPAYEMLMGILHQTESSLYWTLKFFNGLLVTLSVWFFYGFVQAFAGDRRRALWAAFFLAAAPCYLSHFIWSHAMVIPLFFAVFYALQKTRDHPAYRLPAVVMMAAVLVTQPTQAIKCMVMIALWGTASWIVERRPWKDVVWVMLGGGLVSLLWWGPVGMDILAGKFGLLLREGTDISQMVTQPAGLLHDLFRPDSGSATRVYDFWDYFQAPVWNLINNPTGLGEVFLVLLFWALLDRRYRSGGTPVVQRIYGWTIRLWLVFTFLGMNTKTFHFPFGLFAFRFWMLFAVAASLLAAEKMAAYVEAETDALRRWSRAAVVIFGVVLTSAVPKFQINTGVWSEGVYWTDQREVLGYVWLREHFPAGTRVFTFSDNLLVMGVDMRADVWDPGYKKDFAHAMDLPVTDLHAALKRHGFQYLVLAQKDLVRFGDQRMLEKLRDIQTADGFKFFGQIPHAIKIYKIL